MLVLRIPKVDRPIIDVFGNKQPTLSSLTSAVLSYHYQRGFTPMYPYVVYYQQIRNLNKVYTLEELKNAINKAALAAKSSWGIQSIKNQLPEKDYSQCFL